MTPSDPIEEDALVRHALTEARETRALRVGCGARHATADVFGEQFGRIPAVMIADARTFAAAGRDVLASFHRSGLPCDDPIMFSDPGPYAEYGYVDRLRPALAGRE